MGGLLIDMMHVNENEEALWGTELGPPWHENQALVLRGSKRARLIIFISK